MSNTKKVKAPVKVTNKATTYKVTTKITKIRPWNCYASVLGKFESPKWDKITISAKAYLKLMFFINLVGDHEVTGYGKVIDNEVVDFSLPKQILGTLKADVDEQAMTEFIMSKPVDELEYWTVDFHSHNTAPTSASSTDKDNYARQYSMRGNKQFIALIVNKKQEVWCKCVVGGDRFEDVKVEYISPTILSDKEKSEIYDEAKREVEATCTEVKEVRTPAAAAHWYSDGLTTDDRKFSRQTTLLCSECGAELQYPLEEAEGLCYDCMAQHKIIGY